MKKFLGKYGAGFLAGILAVALLVPQILDAAGHIGYRNVLAYLRTGSPNTFEIWVPDVASGNANDMTVGVGGVIITESFLIGTNTLAIGDTTESSTIGAVPYPCKLLIYVKDDASASGALTCTGDIIVSGFNQYGVSTSETITTDLVEGTPVETRWAYETVKFLSAASCSGMNVADSGDKLVVACAPDIGLPFPLDSYKGLISICAHDEDGSNDGTDTAVRCWPGASLNDGSTEDFDPVADTIQLYVNTSGINTTGIGEDDATGGAALAFTFSDGDRVYLRVRPPEGL